MPGTGLDPGGTAMKKQKAVPVLWGLTFRWERQTSTSRRNRSSETVVITGTQSISFLKVKCGFAMGSSNSIPVYTPDK